MSATIQLVICGSVAAQSPVGPDSALPAALPVLPAEVPTLLPPGTRMSFSRDSVVWSNALSVADLLETVPGVYVARTGFTGLPEQVIYAGRGAAGVEYFWDGMPYEPFGHDSVYVDPGALPVSFFSRVDVEIGPSALSVFLVTERHAAIQSRSNIRVISGDFSTGAYGIVFQKRWLSGLGVSLAGDVFSTDGASGPGRSDQRFDLWAKAEWVPDPSTGFSYQIRRQRIDSDEAPGIDAPVGVNRRNGSRTDFRLDFFKASHVDGSGFRLDLGMFSSSWSDDSSVVDTLSTDQEARSAFAGVGFRSRTAELNVRARVADRWINSELRFRAAWMPVYGVMLSANGSRREFPLDRSDSRIQGSLSLFRGPFNLTGTVSTGDVVEAPTIVADTGTSVDDASVRFGFETQILSAAVRYVKRDAFLPRTFADVPVIAAFDTTESTSFAEYSLSLRPASFFTISAWYSDPADSIAFQPPTHGRVDFTFRSKFWGRFRSGAFDLMWKLSAHSWSRGVAGIDDTGAPIELKGITYWESYLQFQIVGFSAFWNLRNAYNAREDYVPGLSYPTNAQTFGVKWEFSN